MYPYPKFKTLHSALFLSDKYKTQYGVI